MKALITLLMIIISSTAFGQSVPNSFSANTSAKAEEVNENFLHLANQFKVNKKTIDCSTDNMTKAIEDGYNHLILNGTCKDNLMINPMSGTLESVYITYGFSSNKPVLFLTLEGGKDGEWDDTGLGSKASVMFAGNLLVKNLTVKQTIYLNNGSNLFTDNATLERVSVMTGSSVDFYNSTVSCDSSVSKTCIKLYRSSSMVTDNLTVNNAGSETAIEVTGGSSVLLKNSTINNTGSSTNSLSVWGNSYLNLENSKVTSSNSGVSIEYNGILELSESSIIRTSGTPTIKLSGPGIINIWDGSSVADITCEGPLASLNKGSSTPTITNEGGGVCG